MQAPSRRTWSPARVEKGTETQGRPHPRRQPRPEKGEDNPFTQALPGRRPVRRSRSSPEEDPNSRTRSPAGQGGTRRSGARGPDLAAASGGAEGRWEPRVRPGTRPPRRARSGRSPVSGGPGRGRRRPRPRIACTFGLAVGAVLVVLLPQQFGQDELVLLVQLLRFLPAGARRHLGSGARNPGHRGQQPGRVDAPGAAGAAGGLGPGSGGGSRRRGGGSADVSRLLARLAPHAPPEPAREAEAERERRRRDFRVEGRKKRRRGRCACAQRLRNPVRRCFP